MPMVLADPGDHLLVWAERTVIRNMCSPALTLKVITTYNNPDPRKRSALLSASSIASPC